MKRKLTALGILTTSIGRRLMLLFLACTLAPLVVFAVLAFDRVSQQVKLTSERGLHDAAKSAGMTLAARLARLRGDLELFRDALQAQGRSEAPLPMIANLHERCVGLWVVDGDGATTWIGSEPPMQLLTAARASAHLAAGNPLLRTEGQRILMLLPIRPGLAGSPLAVAEPNAAWLWETGELRGSGAEVLVFEEGLGLLCSTSERPPDAAPLRRALDHQAASGALQWTIDDQPHMARYWRLFLRPQYDCDLLVVQSRDHAFVLAPVADFHYSFALAAVATLLCVLVASLVQLRRTLDPIFALQQATAKVALGQFDARVTIRGRDEFSALGEAFNRMTAQLGEHVRRREQTERELVASRDTALAAARAKTEFVTNVSHELRTPTAAILSATEILTGLDAADPEAQREFCAMALDGARRLARLVDDVLSLDSGATFDLVPISVEATLQQALAGLPGELRQRVRVQRDAADLPPVTGEPRRLADTWTRLLDNAAKFSPPDTPIVVRLSCTGDRVAVEIVDRGVGVAKDDQARIFEPFCQVGRDQLTDKADGVGLGLTLARNTVMAHGGRIEVDSERGHGATFRVLLPVPVPDTAPAAAAATTAG